MSEAFNNVIMEYIDKPIITLLEGIRFYISSRIVKLRTILMRYEGSICPKVQQIIEKKKHVKHDNHIDLMMLICLCLRLSQRALLRASEARFSGALSKGGKMHGVAANVYLWKTSEKPKETGQNENSKFGSCIYV